MFAIRAFAPMEFPVSKRKTIWVALLLLASLHGAVLLAGFLAPYGAEVQDHDFAFAPPTRIHFTDQQSVFHWRPFVYRMGANDNAGYAEDTTRPFPVHFLVRGGGTRPSWHFFGVDEPARLFLLGTDGYGRDQLSRLLYGGRLSLLAGLLATGLSLGLGVVLGALAGFYGGWVDELLMRATELFLALPWLYLLFAIRAFLPLEISPSQAFLLLIAVVGVVGWARPARMVRGVVLSARQRAFVQVARSFGASDFYLLRRHVLPQAFSVILTQAALLAPQYVLAEVALSYLGLGVGEPTPSWGNMLAALQQYHVLASYGWMFLPGLALVPLFLGYHLLAEAVQARSKGVPI
jgi:peptide/nickel transport system permease protein